MIGVIIVCIFAIAGAKTDKVNETSCVVNIGHKYTIVYGVQQNKKEIMSIIVRLFIIKIIRN